MTTSPVVRRRRAAVLPAGRITLREIAQALGISVITLRRRIRPTRDRKTRQLWTERLDLKVRQRGRSLPVYHARRMLVEEWAPHITGHDLPLRD
jgi:hypothetical protein